jgi:hypothetical protein
VFAFNLATFVLPDRPSFVCLLVWYKHLTAIFLMIRSFCFFCLVRIQTCKASAVSAAATATMQRNTKNTQSPE